MSETPDFENALKQLEAIVQTLEQGELGLEDALARFEEGVRLSQQCQQALKAAELRVSQLTDRSGTADHHAPAPNRHDADTTTDADLDDDLPF